LQASEEGVTAAVRAKGSSDSIPDGIVVSTDDCAHGLDPVLVQLDV
jgi:hypothetical protein